MPSAVARAWYVVYVFGEQSTMNGGTPKHTKFKAPPPPPTTTYSVRKVPVVRSEFNKDEIWLVHNHILVHAEGSEQRPRTTDGGVDLREVDRRVVPPKQLHHLGPPAVGLGSHRPAQEGHGHRSFVQSHFRKELGPTTANG